MCNSKKMILRLPRLMCLIIYCIRHFQYVFHTKFNTNSTQDILRITVDNCSLPSFTPPPPLQHGGGGTACKYKSSTRLQHSSERSSNIQLNEKKSTFLKKEQNKKKTSCKQVFRILFFTWDTSSKPRLLHTIVWLPIVIKSWPREVADS